MDDIPRQLREQGLLRFDYLAGCLPGKEGPSDIDSVIEKNGYFLFIENKRPGQRIELGQEILFDALIALAPEKVRALIVIGNPPDEIQQWGWWRQSLRDGDRQVVRNLVRQWRDWAYQHPR